MALAIVSCGKEPLVQEENPFVQGENPQIDGSGRLEASAPDFELVNFDETKITISQSGSSAPAFAWQEGDVLGVIPMDGKTLQTNFEVKEVNSDPKTATFDGGMWTLKEGKEYAAYYPFQMKTATSKSKLEYSFTGQGQWANNSLAHLSAYDYLYASSVVPDGKMASFSFRHLISIVRLQITVPEDDTFTSVTLESDTPWFANTSSLDLSDGTMSALETVDSFTLPLFNIKVSAGGVLTVWFAMLPTDVLGGKTVSLILQGSQMYPVASIDIDGAIEAGKAYSYSCDMRTYENLSASGTANCYIVNKPGEYRFNASVKGCSTESVGKPDGAAVLWESFGTSETPEVGSIVQNVMYGLGYIHFTTPPTLTDGNAVIAVTDGSGNILWSWHIWVCSGFDPSATKQKYNNDAGTMMDRNLGATSATPGDVRALGLLYQWGRKDPFLGGNAINSTTTVASTLSWPSPEPTSSHISGNNTLKFAIANPTTFIYNTSPWDWYCVSTAYRNDMLWASTKTMYDPCPRGWKVPPGDRTGIWGKPLGVAGYTKDTWDSNNIGINFGATRIKFGNGTIWYPAAGYLDCDDGWLNAVGSEGRYWSYSLNGTYAYALSFNSKGTINASEVYYRGFGLSVRCLAE